MSDRFSTWVKIGFGLMALALFLAAGCANSQQEKIAKDRLELARTAYLEAKANRHVEAFAPLPSYPAPNRTSDEGSSPGKAWHEGLVILRGRLAPPKSPTPTAVAISLQPCGPKVCLPPEQARVFFTLPPAELSRPIEN